MDDDLQIPGMQGFDCLIKDGERITSSDEGSRFLVDGLEAKLYLDGFLAVQPGKKFQDFRRKAVGPGGYGKGSDLRVP